MQVFVKSHSQEIPQKERDVIKADDAHTELKLLIDDIPKFGKAIENSEHEKLDEFLQEQAAKKATVERLAGGVDRMVEALTNEIKKIQSKRRSDTMTSMRDKQKKLKESWAPFDGLVPVILKHVIHCCLEAPNSGRASIITPKTRIQAQRPLISATILQKDTEVSSRVRELVDTLLENTRGPRVQLTQRMREEKTPGLVTRLRVGKEVLRFEFALNRDCHDATRVFRLLGGGGRGIPWKIK